MTNGIYRHLLTLLFGSFSILLGLVMVALALLDPYLVQDQILVTVEKLNSGMDIKTVMPTINGFLAGGSLQSMPTWVIRSLLIGGLLSCYVGCFVIINRSNPRVTLKTLFTFEYWKKFQSSFSFYPHK